MSSATGDEALRRVVRLRQDIEWSAFSQGERPAWVARDPISLEYFHFSQFERSIAQLLDGQRTIADVLNHSTSDSVSPAWLLGLVAKLESACLVVPRDPVVHGRRLWFARNRQDRNTTLQRFMSPLAVRVKLFDPTWLLKVLSPVAKLLFSRTFVTLWFTSLLIVGVSVVLRLLQTPDALSKALAGITAERALVLAVIYVFVKSLHELGHALACKKWDAECHEIGLFFLVFMPCLYCDTSDSWKLPSRWRRACIAAAGIYVELSIAAIGGCVWLLTSPDSVLHLLAANVMAICSVSTVLVNANPLLRYDGYYMLSDLWGVPNLHEQSREASRASATAWLTDRRLPKDRWDASAFTLTVYSLAAWVYRHFVVVMIAWVVWTLLDGVGLSLLGAFLVMFTLANVVLALLIGVVGWVKEVAMIGSVRILRATAVCVAILLGIFTFFNTPWQTYVSSRVIGTFASMKPVYTEHAGVLVSFQNPGNYVTRGSEVARIESPELELELIDTRGRVSLLEQRATQLQGRLVDDESAATELATVIEELSKAQDRLRILEIEIRSLTCLSQEDGILVAGERAPQNTLTTPNDTQNSKPLLSPENTGCFVNRGALLGWISDVGNHDVIAYVVESDAEILSSGMAFNCRWDCDLSTRYRGTISRISPEPISEIPEPLLGDESIPYHVAGDGKLLPEEPHYEVQLTFESMPSVLSHQSLGTVHFETAPRTLFQSVQRYLNQHVRPDL